MDKFRPVIGESFGVIAKGIRVLDEDVRAALKKYSTAKIVYESMRTRNKMAGEENANDNV
ncbi:hypothetical protein CHS0354_017006 [Potamilus streckersoni]|uniref:Uncharacterized protein n=1 Tax=Potamilus streckersoni TaxID=2493646 RepID=A0AAE0VS49_9BIVA|nr:hypothetical protein CHS0354_017006 [Potamilus streckersoni]